MKLILLICLMAAAPALKAQTFPEAGNREAQLQRAQELQKTAADLEEAVRQHPESAELYIRLGFAYAKLEKTEEARKAFETAVKLDPKKAIAHYMLGLIYEKKGMKTEAVAAWKACLESADEPRLRETARKHLHHLGTNR